MRIKVPPGSGPFTLSTPSRDEVLVYDETDGYVEVPDHAAEHFLANVTDAQADNPED